MASVSNILLDQEILLESGTNELELLVFNVAQFRFGINVAKVREVLPTTEITRLAKAHPSVRGVFRLRDQVVPCVSLLEHLGVEPTRAADASEKTLILTDFNQQQTAFLVDEVERIHRISWENILSVPSLDALSQTPVTAVARIDEQLVIMLDFEMVIDQVTESYFRTDAVENPLGLPRESLRILVADDSPTVREAVGNTLRASGYTQLEIFQNGGEAWEWIEARFRETGRVEDVGDLMLSDIEMPQVDGFHLTKRIKEHPQLRQIPVLLYSSIATPDNHKKGAAVGADAQITKPELARVVEIADELIAKGREKSSASGSVDLVDAVAPKTTQAEPGIAPPEPPATPETTDVPSDGAPAEVCSEGEPMTQYESPPGVDRNLWATFRRELADRSSHLRRLIARLSSDESNAEAKNDISRTLHTIKSAAMVVPVDEVTQVTHLVESVLEAAREGNDPWPLALLKKQASWLQELADPFIDPQATLAGSRDLEIELTGALAGMAS